MRKTDFNKGKIQDNALKALLKSNLFTPRIEKKLKGKGSYNRKSRKNQKNYYENNGSFLLSL